MILLEFFSDMNVSTCNKTKKIYLFEFLQFYCQILYNTRFKVNPHKKQQLLIKQSRCILGCNMFFVSLSCRKKWLFGAVRWMRPQKRDPRNKIPRSCPKVLSTEQCVNIAATSHYEGNSLELEVKQQTYWPYWTSQNNSYTAKFLNCGESSFLLCIYNNAY